MLKSWPAYAGGRTRANVLTVGAIDPDGKYHKSSHFGDAVDIAAPGCNVPTYFWNKDTKLPEKTYASGTSVAAPLVAFTSTLIKDAETDTVRLTKRRLVAAGAYDSRLEGMVASGRRLDAANALATPFDTIRTASGRLRIGFINWPASGRAICNNIVKRQDLLQAAYFNGAGGAMVNLATPDSLGVYLVGSCPLLPNELLDIKFTEYARSGTSFTLGEEETIDVRSLRSMTLCSACQLPDFAR